MMSQNLVAHLQVQQENMGFFEIGFSEFQKPREPSVKGVSSGDTPWGKLWEPLGSEPTARERKAAESQFSQHPACSQTIFCHFKVVPSPLLLPWPQGMH